MKRIWMVTCFAVLLGAACDKGEQKVEVSAEGAEVKVDGEKGTVEVKTDKGDAVKVEGESGTVEAKAADGEKVEIKDGTINVEGDEGSVQMKDGKIQIKGADGKEVNVKVNY